ncbi:MAG TPA: DNA polymerase I, partial [Synergistaceae bacterium]|nr:DNA polymerase I [Synergistaceae bacterium]
MGQLPEKTILLVDGHGLAFRAFFALPELNAPDGTPTNALLGYANMLLKTMEDVRPDLAAVVFDAPGPTFRHEAFEAYKEGRQPTPPEFKVQVPL